MVWKQQLDVLIEHYSIKDYLFGGFSSDKFSVTAFQITGIEKKQLIDNPHNNYLLLFYQMPIPFLFAYFLFLIKISKRFFRSWYVSVLLICVACFTNSTIISLHNPIYMMIICFYLTKKTDFLEA
jgi:hypothetical protein